MVSCLNPAFRFAGQQRIWAAYRERAEKLNVGTENPLLTRYIEIVSLQAQLSSILLSTLEVPQADSDRALLSYFNGEALRPLLALAVCELTAMGQSQPPGESLELLEELWNQVEDFAYPRDFAARLVLEVFATGLSTLPHKEIETTPDHCPHCGFTILCSIAREEGMGRKRSGQCSLCSSEWAVARLGCLRCGEQRASNLPVFSFDAWMHIRVEACDSCGGYLKSIDMTKDAAALPLPDDIASSAVNIWAFEQGYQSIGNSLFRL
ncbi:formate dehydrogenase accessory protein FdhE [Alloacidobacterium sp.]|uniref:formate dehydrogenase accessory protein FdhE domain-containing protein n=1 Tax=Alloacidobacterium sp. TaxID=2951999 RepID=UPI002D3DFE72|nr:formate dehydrogenase accessory protein FdhE [Alloacidobacterium sp.]HYK37857.1 formate dehydrogenase accessory protein FdhE [Alloacidobacterium sp.]